MTVENGSTGKRLGVLLIKPSRYDDEGYVIQWWRSFMVANVLSVVAGIVVDAGRRKCLGPDVTIETRLIDEVAEIVRPKKLADWASQFDKTVVFLVGVQTSQFPRALDMARQFTDLGIPVIAGGFHVSGAMAMVPDWEPAFTGVKEAGVTLYAGELENGIDALLADIWSGEIKPLYNYLHATADLPKSPDQVIDADLAAQTFDRPYAMEVSRGCPFMCSFCTIINVHGRTMRHRSLEGIERHVRTCVANGIHKILISDDNFARSPIWREVTELLARLQKELNVELEVFCQVDALATRIKGFVEACRAGGIKRVFIGLESLRPDNLAAASKGQNKVHQMRDMLMTWKRAGMVLYPAIIIGLPNDTPERVMEDIRFLQDELPVDIVEFFLLTPLPGSADHKQMVAEGITMDLDLNRYGSMYAVMDHPKMTRQEWDTLFWNCWRSYYTLSHLKTLIARGLLYGASTEEIRATFVCSLGSARWEGLNALDSGAIRIKDRHTRRPGFPKPWAVPHFLKRLVINTSIATATITLLLYSDLLERWLRREQRKGRLHLHVGKHFAEEARTGVRVTPEATEHEEAA